MKDNIVSSGSARQLSLHFDQFSKEKTIDLLERILIGDVEGLSIISGLSKKKVFRLIQKNCEDESGFKERKVLRTSEARRLKQDLLMLFSKEAATSMGRNKILASAPTPIKAKILGRLEICQTGKSIYDELRRNENLQKLRDVLVGISLKQHTNKHTLGLIKSETLQYFISRNPMIKAAQIILERFDDTLTLTMFLKGIDKESLHTIIKDLEEIEDLRVKDAEAIISDAQLLINEKFHKGGITEEKARQVIEDKIFEIVSSLKMNWEEENDLRKAALETLSLPFEFEVVATRGLIERWKQRQSKEQAEKLEKIEASLKKFREMVRKTVESVILLDQMLAIATVMDKYGLTIPKIGSDGIALSGSYNIFLLKENLEGIIEDVKPVSYSLGKTQTVSKEEPRNVVILTGANSGGKTTLLTTLATIHILTLLGLPVPCERADVVPLPIYLFRRRITKKIGSLEQALKALIPVFADRQRKLVLMDEFEALTEPGAAGRILATLINRSAASSSLVLLVTHLARETLPHVKLPVRVDGIEAIGLDKKGELIVDRQPRFNHVGSSTPKFIIEKLSRSTKKKRVKTLYGEVLKSLEAKSDGAVQTPINLPWISDKTVE